LTQTISNHTADSLQLSFEGLMRNPQSIWGLDNVIVSVQSSSGSLPLTNASFTLSAWAQRSQVGEAQMLLSQGSAAANQGLQFGFRANNRFTCGFWNNDLTTSEAYTDTEWHHWACTYDASSGRRALYRDGVLVDQDNAGGNYQ